MTIFGQDWRYEDFVPKYKNEILDSTNIKNSSSSRVLRDLTFIGAFEELYKMNSFVDTTLETIFMDILKDSKLKNAQEYILSKSATEKILIINESHHRPEHRKFTTSLLGELYNQGYRYLALEALHSTQHHTYTNYPLNKFNLGDTTIMTRGYPLMKACSGTYVKEAQFGNMIRKAIKLGFTLVGYEKTGKNRELDQAKNIANILDIDPQAKIIVHCGYGHLIEEPIINRKGQEVKMMAGHLKNITGINPFTIDQTEYYYLANINEIIFAKTEDSNPQIIIHQENTFKSHEVEKQKYYDLTLFHEPITYVDNRPSWLVNEKSNYVFQLNNESVFIDYPIRIKLLPSQDRLDAVPIDIIESDNPNEVIKLYGGFQEGKLVVENKGGDRQIIHFKGSSVTNIKG